jgi:hypothetical protein
MRAIVCQQSSAGKNVYISAFSAFITNAKYTFILIFAEDWYKKECLPGIKW